MTTLIKALALLLLGPAYNALCDCFKIKLIKTSLNIISHLRVIFYVRFIFSLSLLMMVSGFALLPIALYLYLPWTSNDKALMLVIVSGAYVLCPLILILCLFSSANWIKMWGAKDLSTRSDKNR